MARGRGPTATLAAVAGLTYATLAAAESIDVLGAPDRSSSTASVVRYYTADHSVLVFVAVAGTLALFAYVVFAAATWSWLRSLGGRADPWATIGLVAGVAGPVLAGAGHLAQAMVVVRGSELSDERLRALTDTFLTSQIVGLGFIALTILGLGTAAYRVGMFPRPVALVVWTLAAYALVASGAALTTAHGWQRVAMVAFIGHTVWVVAVSGWLLLPRWTALGTDSVALVATRVIFGAVAVAAGVSGVALVVFPASTPRFFSWGLGPPPLAALIGGFYLAAALVFALALSRPWIEVRGLLASVFVLSAPVFVVSLVHRHTFDFDKLQAWLWMVLFALFPLTVVVVLFLQRRVATDATGPRLPRAAALTLGAVAAALVGLSVALLISPGRITWAFALPPLGGRVLASWLLFLAFLATWAASRSKVAEARLGIVALLAFFAAAAASGLRTFGQLESGRRVVHVAVAGLLVLVVAAVQRAANP